MKSSLWETEEMWEKLSGDCCSEEGDHPWWREVVMVEWKDLRAI